MKRSRKLQAAAEEKSVKDYRCRNDTDNKLAERQEGFYESTLCPRRQKQKQAL